MLNYTISLLYNYKLLQSITTRGSGRWEFNDLCGITGELNGFIIVADSRNQCVSIFNKHGNCIHCFGSRRSVNDQFNFPYGIALSPNGNIYISDYDNKRIQIFSNY